ncbi:hypothetical protein PENANT_c009G08123 [Penicillium antarcticum]|uniref:Uncharacterized protein n=1 Tax=Penicillium antarcticum TaxID=416450 RepID=A0A1V6Q8Y3_9EURO|nr:hypothetical protein PENANT_c009G08123 [Penicillium antarcticum]
MCPSETPLTSLTASLATFHLSLLNLASTSTSHSRSAAPCISVPTVAFDTSTRELYKLK